MHNSNNPNLVHDYGSDLVMELDTREARIPVGNYLGTFSAGAIQRGVKTSMGTTTIAKFQCTDITDMDGNPVDVDMLTHSVFIQYRSSKSLKTFYKNMTGEEVVPTKIDFGQFLGAKVKIYVDHDTTDEGDVFEKITATYRVEEDMAGEL